MIIKTRHFGEVDLDDEKIIEFENGIMGFEDCKRFTILFDNEAEERSPISWLQSIDDPMVALPVVSPITVMAGYNPVVEDEYLEPLGKLNDENLVILLSIRVPQNIRDITVNLKAPFIINSDTKKGCQLIAENKDYDIQYNVYKLIEEMKQQKIEKQKGEM